MNNEPTNPLLDMAESAMENRADLTEAQKDEVRHMLGGADGGMVHVIEGEAGVIHLDIETKSTAYAAMGHREVTPEQSEAIRKTLEGADRTEVKVVEGFAGAFPSPTMAALHKSLGAALNLDANDGKAGKGTKHKASTPRPR